MKTLTEFAREGAPPTVPLPAPGHHTRNDHPGAGASYAADGVASGDKTRQAPRLLDRLTSAERKQYPMASGLIDYFPDALAAVANISFRGNEKHNPGQPVHWARGKSMDHADCIARHLEERGGFDPDGNRHSAQLAWRSLALLQEELEAEFGLAPPRGATVPPANDAVLKAGRAS